MKNPESKFSKWLADNVLVNGDVMRVENTSSSGTPDINYAFKYPVAQYECWIETKITDASFDVTLRPYQWAWFVRRRIFGRVFLAVEAGSMFAIFDGRKLKTCLRGDGYMHVICAADLMINKSDSDKVMKVHDLLIS